ncbi:MAG: helix-turn-helix domain-containing protein [Flavobacteriales bacterium]|nr:helix-turn-helix domain-containing protein [Flavobacteriales bacterium]
MEVIVIEKEAYYKMIAEQTSYTKRAVREAVKEIMQELTVKNDGDEWLSRDEAMQILGIKSKTTLQKLRDDPESKIVFSKNGRIIKYRKTSLYEYLQRHIVE